jgi:very-short-patch-repair endonuclease
MLLDQIVKMKWSTSNRDWYTSKNYQFTKMRDEFGVKASDLPKNSNRYIYYKCDYCGETNSTKYQDYMASKNIVNKDACKKCKIKKRDEIIKILYGVDNVRELDFVNKKIKQTNLNKYGCENQFQNNDIKEKIKQTNLEKRGVEYFSQSDEFKQKTCNAYFVNGTCKTSKQQIQIYQELRNQDYNVVLNYPVSKCNLDVAVFTSNINIDIEYDGLYWHDDAIRDRRRDEFVKSKGWKILRIKSIRQVPELNEIIDKINWLINNPYNYTEIIMEDAIKHTS